MRLENSARALLVFIAVLAPLSVIGPAAMAQSRYGSGGAAPLDRLLPEIRRTHPGEFYDAEGPTPGPDGQLHYRLKWMTPDGRIIWLDADARTGRVTGSDTGPAPDSRSYGNRSYDRAPPGPAPQWQGGGGGGRGSGRDDRGHRRFR